MKKMNRAILKVLLILVVLSLVFFLVGCWDRVETNDLAIITGAAIDEAKNGEIELSFQIFVPKFSGSASEGGSGMSDSGAETIVISETGKSIADALDKMQQKISRKIFWGICKIIIFSEEIAKNGIHHHMDFFLRHPEPRERAFIFVSQGEAKKILSFEGRLERYSSELLREMSNQDYSTGVTLIKLDEMLSDQYEGTYLPYLTMEEQDGKAVAVVNGLAIFKNNKLIEKFSKDLSQGLLWINNELEEYTISTEVEKKGEIAFYPVISKVKLIPKIEDGTWRMLIKTKVRAEVSQNLSRITITDRGSLKQAENALAKKFEHRLKDTIAKAMDMKIDTLQFGKQFQRKYPGEWKKVQDNWEEKFPDIEVQFVTDVIIKRKGFINQTLLK